MRCSPGTSDGPGQEAQVTAEDYFKASVSEVLLANCLSCHNANGIAKGTRLVYVDEAGSQQNYETLRGFIAQGNGALLLSKIRGVRSRWRRGVYPERAGI